MKGWHYYIGLPHVFGADPRDGKGADCLIMTMAVMDELGLPHPSIDARLFVLAKQGRYDELREKWLEATESIPCPVEGSTTLFINSIFSIGLGVVVDGGLLFVDERRGVTWAPLNMIKSLEYRVFL